MRILHTADWHLGRILHGVHLTDDQAHVLTQLVEIVAETRPDVVVVAGDVYDRAIPPPDAVALLDDTLACVADGLRTPVVLIAGNHDSPERLGFGARLLAAGRLHVVGRLPEKPAPLVLEDAHGPVEIHALPFAEPPVVRERTGDPGVRDTASALHRLLDDARKARNPRHRAVLVAHAAVLGCETTESERPLSIGGTDAVPPRIFEGFDYVALGHFHRAQAAGAPRVRYAGSLLPYSLSEIGQDRSVSLVELDAAGRVAVEEIALRPRRALRRVEGTLAELEAAGRSDPAREDYVVVRLLDRGPLLDPVGRLRSIWPNLLHIERPSLAAPDARTRVEGARRLRGRSEIELFADFVRETTGEELGDAERVALGGVLEALARREREAD